jgi:hypothetical protein
MKQNKSKMSLLSFAKGVQPQQPGLIICLYRETNGEVKVAYSSLLENGKRVVIRECQTQEDIEFFKTFEAKPLIERTLRELTHKLHEHESKG